MVSRNWSARRSPALTARWTVERRHRSRSTSRARWKVALAAKVAKALKMPLNVPMSSQAEITLSEPLAVRDGVVLRRWRSEDAPAIAEACSDPEIATWIPLPQPYPIEEALRYVGLTEQWWRTGEQFVLCVARGNEVLGSISLRLDRDRASIGYWLAPEARGRGIMTQAVKALTGWASEVLDLREVWIFVQAANQASRAVAERAGFIEHHERVVWPDGKERMLFRRSLGAPNA